MGAATSYRGRAAGGPPVLLAGTGRAVLATEPAAHCSVEGLPLETHREGLGRRLHRLLVRVQRGGKPLPHGALACRFPEPRHLLLEHVDTPRQPIGANEHADLDVNPGYLFVASRPERTAVPRSVEEAGRCRLRRCLWSVGRRRPGRGCCTASLDAEYQGTGDPGLHRARASRAPSGVQPGEAGGRCERSRRWHPLLARIRANRAAQASPTAAGEGEGWR
jgi:hypothetical protein